MTREHDLILVGRGDSVRDFEWPWSTAGTPPIGAISSGAFVISDLVRSQASLRPRYLFTLDPPKYYDFVGGAWRADKKCQWWPVNDDQDVEKHVPQSKFHGGYERVVNVDPPYSLEWLVEVYRGRNDASGWQAGWCDFDNIHPWDYNKHAPISFVDGEMLGGGGTNNSLLFGLQVAHRLGHRDVLMVGCDLNCGTLGVLVEVLRYVYPLARRAGMHWSVSSDRSALSSFLHVEAPIHAT
jgi:hypothetical protein